MIEKTREQGTIQQQPHKEEDAEVQEARQDKHAITKLEWKY
jgi:hypothetical protein